MAALIPNNDPGQTALCKSDAASFNECLTTFFDNDVCITLYEGRYHLKCGGEDLIQAMNDSQSAEFSQYKKYS